MRSALGSYARRDGHRAHHHDARGQRSARSHRATSLAQAVP